MGRFIKVFSSFSFITLISFLMVCPAFSIFEGSDDHDAWRDSIFGETSEMATLPDSTSESKSSSSEVLRSDSVRAGTAADQSEELSDRLNSPVFRSSVSSPNYSLTPDQIPFYKLADIGYSNVLDIVKDILANNTNYTMLVNIVSDNVARINICEGGNIVGLSRTTSSGTTNQRVFYGSVFSQSKENPKWYGFEYRVSTDKWYNGRNSWMNDSFFGRGLNGTLSSEKGMNAFCVIQRSVSTTSARDWYFYGFISYNYKTSMDSQSILHATFTNYDESASSVSPPVPRYNFYLDNNYYCFGEVKASRVSDIINGVYLSTQNYVSLQVEAPPETYNTDYNSFQTAIQDFITKTSDFNTLMADNRTTLKNNVKSYFDAFNQLVPQSVIIVLILLIIIIVAIGVFK